MPRQANLVASAAESRLNGLDQYLRRMETAYANRAISKVDLERTYCGAFLQRYIAFEHAIEALFIGLLIGNIRSGLRGVEPLIGVRSHRTAVAILKGDRKFIDWLPYENTRRRADAFFSKGQPFSLLTTSQISAFEDMRAIRNAIAHDGGVALKLFKRRMIESKNLPQDQHRPASYLRGMAHGTIRRNDILSANALATLRALCK